MSSQAELEESELQLVQINQALKDSPDDSELLALRAELENLIQLTKDYLKQQASASTSSSSTSRQNNHDRKASGSTSGGGSNAASTANFTTGTHVVAKWHQDHKFYSALIANVAGSEDDPVYTVIFDVDKSTEVLRKADVKPLTESKKRAMEFSAAAAKDSDGAASDSASGSGPTKKARVTQADKSEKKAQKEEDRKARVAEQNSKQSSWQSFAKKSTKKGVHIPGVKGESLFKTPDNPYGRVGVTGSGKGMTSYAAKQRVKFIGAEGEGEEQP